MKYGVFLQTIFDFVIIAAAIFMAIKAINRLKTPPPPARRGAARGRGAADRDSRPAEEVVTRDGHACRESGAPPLSAHSGIERDCPCVGDGETAIRRANASRVRFSGAPDAVQATSSSMRMPPYGCRRSHDVPGDVAAEAVLLRLVEQQVDEVEARLDRDDEPRLEPARQAQVTDGPPAAESRCGPDASRRETRDVVHLQAEQVPDAVREEHAATRRSRPPVRPCSRSRHPPATSAPAIRRCASR